MILQNKKAVIYGAGGSLGSAVAKAFATAGAKVFLTGYRPDSIRKTAEEITAGGGAVETAIVDAFDENAIREHLNKLRQTAGHIDISFNAIDVPVVQNIPLTGISVEDFVSPVTRTMQTRFLTAIAAARIMMQQQSGVILSVTATPGGIGYPYTGGFAAACCATEALTRNLAAELGVYGIRAVNIRSGGSPDSRVFREAIAANPGAMATILHGMEQDTMLKRLPPMNDIAHTAVFLASDLARSITGVTVDVTCGTTAGLNHRATLPNLSDAD